MIERPSAKPGIVNSPETARADERTPAHGQSVEQRPVADTSSTSKPKSPLAVTSDSFATSSTAPNTQVGARPVERGLDKAEGKPVGPRSKAIEPLLEGAKQVQVERGDGWEQTLARHYGHALTPEMVRLVAAVNGQKNPDSSPPSIIAAPALEQLYFAQHPGEREASRAIIRESSFVVVSPGQSIQDVIRSHYDVKDEQVVKVLGEAALYLNDASRYAAPPGVMALPSIDGLNNLILRMKREIEATQKRRDAVDEIAILPPLPPTPGRKLRTLLVSDKSTLYTIPTEGARYQTEWNDRLADVVLYVYRDELTDPSLTPEQAEERLKELMLAVARVNDLTTVDIGAVRELYLPELKDLERFMGDRQVRQNSQRFKRANNLMWKAIEQTSVGAKNKALSLKKVDIRDSAPDGDERMKQIAEADSAIKDMQVEQAFDNAPTSLLPYIGTMLWVVDALRSNQEVKAGQLELRRADETTSEYAQRLFNQTVSARELELFEQHPEMLLAVHLKVMSRNGKFEPGQRDALKEGLLDLGLMGDDGKIDMSGCTSTGAIDAITAKTFLDNVDLDLSYEEGESIDSFFSRALRESPVEGDQETIRQLLFFNVMAKRQLQRAEEQSTDDVVVEPPSVDLDDVEMSMGLRSGVGYENFGSTLSDYERLMVAEVFFDEPAPVVESQSTYDDTYVSERAERVYTDVLIACSRREDRAIELTDAQKEELKEAFLDMIRMLAAVEESVDRYELRIQEGMRVVMSKLISGEPLGAPASWFG